MRSSQVVQVQERGYVANAMTQNRETAAKENHPRIINYERRLFISSSRR